jgi:hypothetical protein
VLCGADVIASLLQLKSDKTFNPRPSRSPHGPHLEDGLTVLPLTTRSVFPEDGGKHPFTSKERK